MLIKPHHLKEWVDHSGVSEKITRLNVESFELDHEIDELLNRNTKSRWKSTDWGDGGWFVCGVEPKTGNQTYVGGQFKPDKPTGDRKYLGISDSAANPLFLNTGEKDYWKNVVDDKSAIVITEGAKKAGCLLTIGLPAISLSGVSTGQKLGRLRADLLPFFAVGRRVYLCFDSDVMTKKPVQQALDKLGRLIAEKGAMVSIINLPATHKGVDDFIVDKGSSVFFSLVDDAQTFEEWRKSPVKQPDVQPENIQHEGIETEDHFNQIAIASIYFSQRYICLNDVLHRWTGTHYEPSTDATEKRRITKFCNSYKYYDGKLRKYTHRYATDQSVNGVLKWLKNSCGVDPDDVNPSGLNLLNGVLTLTWKGREPIYTLKKHNPDIIYTHVSKVKYDPNADPYHCEKLLSILEPAQQKILLKVIASTLDTASVRAKVSGRSIRCLLLKGTGNNGKDTLRECVEQIFGASTTACSLSDFRDYDQGRKFNLAPLANSKINWSPENTDSLLLDRLEVMKAIVTGDPLWIEGKNLAAYSIKPEFAMIFNVNKMPALSGAQEAIKSRYAILSFDKTIVENPDPNNPNEIKGDQRYKYDSEFQQEMLCPALLNRLLEALTQLMLEGIDYSSCDAAILAAREDSCHLLKWSKEIGLEYGDGRIRIGDLFNDLEQWYVDTDVLEIEDKPMGGKKLVWIDEGDKYDPFVKSSRLMRSALAKVFPNAKFSERTMHGVFVIGIQSPKFAVLPNFGSFGSLEKQNQEGESDTGHDPKYDPNNFGSLTGFGSLETKQAMHDPNDPNYFDHDSKKADNHAVYDANDPNDPKNYYSQPASDEQALKIGDRVDVFKYKTLCEKFSKINPPDRGYIVRELAYNNGVLQATIKHPKMRSSLVVDADWLFIPDEVTA